MAITKDDILVKMGQKGVVVLNVLPRADFEKLCIKGSVCIHMDKARPDDFVREVEKTFGKDKFIITYCTGYPCMHFKEAADALVKAGFQAVGYAGGIQEWSEAGMPVAGTMATA